MGPKVVHVSTSDVTGGAAIAAYRLHTSLLEKGYDSGMFVRDKVKNHPSIVRFIPPANNIQYKLQHQLRKKSITRALSRYAQTKPLDKEIFTVDRSVYGKFSIDQMPEADIYHLHWMSNFMDFGLLFKHLAKRNKPVVWTLHDMNPFTGGCHHDDDCGKFAQSCGKCPQLGSHETADLSNTVWNRKKTAYQAIQKNKMHIATDSDWLADCARKSSAFSGFEISTVHYGLDTNIFAPRDKLAARTLFGIDKNRIVIAFGAANLNNRRKGLHYLLEAMGFLEKDYKNLLLLVFGDGTFETSLTIPILNLGPVINYHMLSFIYNAADIFVISSVREAFGQTCLEAMACGTPAVGFNGGGIPDMIKEGFTGFMGSEWDTRSLAEALKKLIVNEAKRKEMGLNCRQFVLENFSLDLQLNKYLSIYHKLLA